MQCLLITIKDCPCVVLNASKSLKHKKARNPPLAICERASLSRLMTGKPRFVGATEQQICAGFRNITALCEEHLSLALEPQGKDSAWSVDSALDVKNRERNRYSNVLPWNRTRVCLDTASDGSDYTNASFVKLGQDGYIAAQGPLENTVHHFWSMCYTQAKKTKSLAVLIAMVTPLIEQSREKCCKYWPSKSEKSWDMSEALVADRLMPISLTVTWVSEETQSDFLLTKFNLASGDDVMTVYHYYYLGWRDTLTPNSVQPLFLLSKRISVLKQQDPNLVPIVHCSAGVGRTGTFMAIDHLLRTDLLETPEKDIVYEIVKKLREHRMMMVQTVHQYRFLYQVAESIYRSRLS